MKDYYRILGVPRDASPEDIKRAYRKLASQHHPDKGGDKEQFQEIQQAYSVLGNEQAKQQYDNPHAQGIHMQFGPGGFGPGGFDLDQFFSMFGHGMRNQHARTPRLTLWIGLRDVAEGGSRTVALQINDRVSNIQIDIPQGLSDGDSIRYPGLAPDGMDLVITYRIKNEPGWTREGSDIITELDVNIYDLILGGQVTIQDIRGKSILLTVPANTQPGSLLRMRGQGLPPSTLPGRHGGRLGDMLVRVRAKLPHTYSQDILDAMRRERGQ